VPIDRTLDRVREDLSAGQLGRARQRLRGLIASFPERLDLRVMLAETYREEGQVVQAGRWSFLDEDADPAEIEAFLLACPDPVQRMRKIRWSDTVDVTVAGPFAARRLTELRAAAEQATGAPVSWQQPRHRAGEHQDSLGERLATAGCGVAVLVVLVLAVVGAVVVVRALLG
jgi:hypothetical protein